MIIDIKYKVSSSIQKTSNPVLFVDEKFNISGLKKHFSKSEFSYVSDLLKNKEEKKRY